MDDCPNTIVGCHQCDEFTARMNMKHHLDNVCMESVIECTFKAFGCNHNLKRKDEKKHVEDAAHTHSHLVQVATEHTKLKRKVEEMENKNKKLSARVVRQQKEVNAMKARM